MGTEIAEVQTASLTLAPNSDEARLLRFATDERELTDEQFAIVEHIANGSPPAIPMATDDDVRAVIGSLAGTLKAPRTSIEHGRLKLGMFRKVITGQITTQALNHAADRALRELEWMPTPAELLRLAADHTATATLLHGKAQTMTQNRRQRLFDETLSLIAERKLLEEELAALDDYTAKVAETRGTLIIRLDGARQYRTKENIHAHLRDVKARAQAHAAPDERITHAGDGQ